VCRTVGVPGRYQQIEEPADRAGALVLVAGLANDDAVAGVDQRPAAGTSSKVIAGRKIHPRPAISARGADRRHKDGAGHIAHVAMLEFGPRKSRLQCGEQPYRIAIVDFVLIDGADKAAGFGLDFLFDK
jgi:hypothetical protein